MRQFRISRRILTLLLIAPTLAVVLSVTIFPLFYAAWTSLLDWNLLYTPFGSAPFVGGANYLTILENPFFWRTNMLVTVLYSAGSTGIEFLAGLGLAILLAAAKPRGEKIFRVIFVMPILMAPIAVGYIWKYMMEPSIGLVNFFLRSLSLPAPMWNTSASTSLISVILVDAWQWTSFTFLIFLAAIYALPAEPYEAASIDGASTWSKFRFITLRLLTPIIIIVVLIRLMDTMKFIDVIYAMTTGGPAQTTEILAYYIFKQTFQTFWISVGAAGSFILLLIVNIFANVFIRYLPWER